MNEESYNNKQSFNENALTIKNLLLYATQIILLGSGRLLFSSLPSWMSVHVSSLFFFVNGIHSGTYKNYELFKM